MSILLYESKEPYLPLSFAFRLFFFLSFLILSDLISVRLRALVSRFVHIGRLALTRGGGGGVCVFSSSRRHDVVVKMGAGIRDGPDKKTPQMPGVTRVKHDVNRRAGQGC